MKKIFEWFGGFALIAFSFYFTDRVSLMVASKSDLMNEIKAVSAEYDTDYVDASINTENNTIVPGLYGKHVNAEESYLKMNDFGSLNENYLMFDYVKPKVSLENNKDKYITNGNPRNKQVSIIIEHDTELENYLNTLNIKYNIIVTSENQPSFTTSEFINGEYDKDYFIDLNSKLNDGVAICIKDYSNIEMCKNFNYYIIAPQLNLQNSNIVEVKNSVTAGSLILVSSNAKLENVKLLLNEIKYKDLQIVFVSTLINEVNT